MPYATAAERCPRAAIFVIWSLFFVCGWNGSGRAGLLDDAETECEYGRRVRGLAGEARVSLLLWVRAMGHFSDPWKAPHTKKRGI